MKRFKTKQEWDKTNDFGPSRDWVNDNKLWGLPIKNGMLDYAKQDVIKWGFYHTTNPHPFDSMDIKVRVTPKQSKKLQKKAFKMGYYWAHIDKQKPTHLDNNTWGLHLCEGKSITGTSCDDLYNDHWKSTELTYKQFMNGTVPKKKEFKVGDWVEIFDPVLKDETDIIGAVAKVLKVQTSNPKGVYLDMPGESLNNHFYYLREVNHTTKPKEQPLKFKEWEVKVGCGQVIQIGCKSFDRSELQTALRVMNTVNEHTDVNSFRTWLDSNKEKLGL